MWHGIQTGIQTAEPRSRRSQAKILNRTETILGFPCSSAGKESTCSTGDLGSIPKLGRFPGEGNGNPLQYSCLENPMDRGAWQAMGPQRIRHDWTRLSNFTFMHWRRKWQPTPVFLPGESQGRGSLVGCHLWRCTESDMTKVT